jgi:AcrR family transcriptional regulator
MVAAKKPVAPRASKRKVQFEHRCQRFVEVAEKLFMKHGFAGTSVNEIVRIAGGSLATLYAEFANKEELFEAVMSRRGTALFADVTKGDRHKADLRGELRQLATHMLDRMLAEDALAIYRLAVHEGPKLPVVRKAVLVNGLDAFLDHLAAHLSSMAGTERIPAGETRQAAEDFLTLVKGQLRTVAAIGAERIPPAQRKVHVEHAVDAFLKIYPAVVKPAKPRTAGKKRLA